MSTDIDGAHDSNPGSLSTSELLIGLSLAGDNLDPDEIRRVLPVPPRRAHRKGERYYSGRRAGYLTGRTGIWSVATDALTDSRELADHVAALKRILVPIPGDYRRLDELHDILRTGARAKISLYWYGHAGDTPPEIPAVLVLLAQELGATIEPDYHTETETAARRSDRRCRSAPGRSASLRRSGRRDRERFARPAGRSRYRQ